MLPDALGEVPVVKISEVQAIGRGGQAMAGLVGAARDETPLLVASAGSGTALIKAQGDTFAHVSGTAVGGGTMLGLARLLLRTMDPVEIEALAERGDRNGADLSLADVITGPIGSLPADATAVNFGRLGRRSFHGEISREDLAAALVNLVAQTIALVTINTAKAHGCNASSSRATCWTWPPSATSSGWWGNTTPPRLQMPGMPRAGPRLSEHCTWRGWKRVREFRAGTQRCTEITAGRVWSLAAMVSLTPTQFLCAPLCGSVYRLFAFFAGRKSLWSTAFLVAPGVRVSALCFGTMSFGSEADESTSAALYRRCRDAGINFFDCANVYGRGRAEEILGQFMAGERDELIITSKVGYGMRDGLNGAGLARRHIVREVEDSLRRLQTDRIDVYFVHRFDPRHAHRGDPGRARHAGAAGQDPLSGGEQLGRLADRQGAGHLGAGGVGALRLSAAHVQPHQAPGRGGAPAAGPGRGAGGDPLQPAGRRPADRQIRRARAVPTRGRLTENEMYSKRYGEALHFEVAERFTAYAQERGLHPAALAVAWVMAHPAVTAPILGARSVEQLAAALAAADIAMTPAWRAEISALSYEPAMATDRTEERQP